MSFSVEQELPKSGEAPALARDAVGRLRGNVPEAFVDDYLPYLRGVPGHVHTALVLRAPNGSPNEGVELSLAKSVHDDLPGFADFWLRR